ncbi:MAG: hypothetical protein ABIR96_05255 [Bdellovibrionota bacterium]
MDAVFPWVMVGLSLAMIYLEHVMREMEQNAVKARVRGQLSSNYPIERLSELRARLESRRSVMWTFAVVGFVWGLQNIFF